MGESENYPDTRKSAVNHYQPVLDASKERKRHTSVTNDLDDIGSLEFRRKDSQDNGALSWQIAQGIQNNRKLRIPVLQDFAANKFTDCALHTMTRLLKLKLEKDDMWC